MRIQKQKMEEFKARSESYNYLRQERASLFQSVAVVFGTTALILLIDIFSKEDLTLRIFLMISLFTLAWLAYKKSLMQTQKPIFVGENIVATIESGPHNVRGEDGKEYSIFKISQTVHQEKP